MKTRIFYTIGAHGKSGKTSLALSIGLYYLTKGYSVVWIDANACNADLEKCFEFFHMSQFNETHNYTESIYTISFNSPKTLRIVSPTVPLEIAKDVHGFVMGVVNRLSDVKVFVVDTNFSAHSLSLIVNGTKKEYRSLDVTVFHSHAFDSLFYSREMKRTRDAITKMEDAGFWVVHVFSAHLLQILHTLAFRRSKGVKQVTKMFDVFIEICSLKERETKYLPYGEIHEYLRIGRAQAYKFKGTRTVFTQFNSIWYDVFEGILMDLAGDKVPVNILLIPYFKDYVQIVSRICIQGCRSVREIRELMKSYFCHVAKHLEFLEKERWRE